MRAAVLASGPSLVSTWARADWTTYDVILAVNVAATLFPCDWWVAGDGHAFSGFTPLRPPRAGVVTDALTFRRCAWWPDSGQRVQRWCEFRAPFGSGQWHTSGPAAVGFAALVLKATSIDCYGMDLAGSRDLDGSPACSASGAHHRWSTEAAELAAIATACRVPITRHLVDAFGLEYLGTVIDTLPPPPPAASRCGYCGRQTLRPHGAGLRCGACGYRASIPAHGAT